MTDQARPERPDRDVHTEHCCLAHGCKYGDKKCTVEFGGKVQSYSCEVCSKWTKEWPTKPGFYWFIGHPYGKPDPGELPSLHPVVVIDGGIYVCGSAFMYKSEGADGYWLPLAIPGLPWQVMATVPRGAKLKNVFPNDHLDNDGGW